jgi:hypothetical protein
MREDNMPIGASYDERNTNANKSRWRFILLGIAGAVVGCLGGAVVGFIVSLEIAHYFIKPSVIPNYGAAFMWMIGGPLVGGAVGTAVGCCVGLFLARWIKRSEYQ